ncbi:MAG: NUDIX domain-containing protein [Alphaproteobacteria bacterium]|nr:NUDIX domain-containing protein [Alphaproteobacteria bacterium]
MVNLRTRVFQAWFRFRRPMTMGVRAAVENDEGHVLMVRHTYTKGWFLPGGGVEKDEPAIEAIRRELVEEGGVQLDGTPLLVGVYSNHRYFRNDHVVLYRVPSGFWMPCKATSRGEIAETAWVDPLAPPEGTTPGNARRLRELYGGADIDPFW